MMVKKHIVNICPLCLQEKKLELSHIISKFVYRPVKEKHKTMLSVIVGPKIITRPYQDGFKEYLLCGDCEDKRQVYETYVSKIIHGNILFKEDQNIYVIKNIDYQKFKLFLLFNLFMFAASKLPEFSSIRIPEYFDDLRDMVYNDDPGSYDEFGCILYLLSNENRKLKTQFTKDDRKRIVIPPVFDKRNDFYRISTIFGGLKWTYYLTHKNLMLKLHKILFKKMEVLL